MRLYILGGACAVFLTVCAALWTVKQQNDRLRVMVAAQARSISALEAQRAQARLAADVATAVAKREAARAAEYDALREALLRGEEDAELPEWFRAYLRDLGFVGLPSPQ